MGIKRRVVDLLAPYPRLFFPVARLLGPRRFRGHLVQRQSEIVISGFPRSANTYAVFAFLQPQGRPVSIGRHLHVEAEVFEAARRSVPAIVLIRRAPDAIRSLKAVSPQLKENRALRRWIKYYRRIEPFSDAFVVADFEQATNDFGSVIDRVNRRFGTTFARFETTSENQAHVFEEIKREQEALGTQRFAGVPTPARRNMLQRLDLKLSAELLAQAEAIYRRFAVLASDR